MLDKKEFKKLIEGYYPLCIDAIKALVSYPSVLDEENMTSSHPFGKSIDDCLRATLAIFEREGMKTVYGDGYYGYAEFGEGTEMVAILGHIDVVPADPSEWDTHPFKAEEKNGRLYGRGTQDDKGPTMTALYGFLALKKMGVKFNKRVRFIIGADEESLWRCISKYLEKEEVPTMGFTPDAHFPLTNAEKGLLEPKLVANLNHDFTMKGGTAFNVVPNSCTYKGPKKEALKKALEELKFDFEEKDDSIVVLGKAAHAAQSFKGVNAISRMAIALHKIGVKSPSISFLASEIKEEALGETLFGKIEDAPSGPLTVNIGMIDISNGKETICFDTRIPVTFKMENIIQKLKSACVKHGLTYEDYDSLPSLYVPKDHPLIVTLRKVYEDITGFDSEPMSSGGATYAKSLKNCVAFGAILPNSEETEHQANEYFALEDYKICMEIYGHAIYELTR